MNARTLYDFLEGEIPSSLSEDWDNDGIMCCPDPAREVKKVLIALDITERVADYAIAGGFDVIVSHHPMVFYKLGGIDPTLNTSRKLIKLIKNGISAFSFHTRLDALCGGVNDVLAEILGMKNAKPFGPAGVEIGRIGDIESKSVEDFCLALREKLGAPFINCAPCGESVSRLAVLGGDGKDFVAAARAAGADTFVSGQFNYNIMVEARETGMTLIEAGHFFTEDPVCGFVRTLIARADESIMTEKIISNELKVY